MATYVFTSHDGFGLGHVRRNVSLADAVLRADPQADITILTGVTADVPWLQRRDMRVVRVPSLVKDEQGRYRNDALRTEEVAERRSALFRRIIDTVCPDVVVVDRHPFGTVQELRDGLERCNRLGVATVLGLRDIIDEPDAVRTELTGPRWDGATAAYDQVLVYGAQHVCDHRAEYGLAVQPEYVGWVHPRPMQPRRQPTVDERLLVIAAGGGADGNDVRRLGAEVVRHDPRWHGLMILGPLADTADERGSERLDVLGSVDNCGELLSRAGASLQMAGYNSTVEALAAGVRPLLVPRRAPRREQAIRATRFASLGVADAVDAGASVEEVAWLLQRPRRFSPTALADAGIDLRGADRTAQVLCRLADARRQSYAAIGAGR